ncbi:hypothetical protein ACO0QE_000874 [Hanseniaspora vineae]
MSLVYQTHNQAHAHAHAHASAPYGYHNNVNNQMVPGAHYYPQNATYMPQGYVAQQFQHPYQQPQQQLQEQPSAGGVCETVDYDFKMMTEFVIQNAYLTFDKEIITDFDDKTLENSDVVEIFTNGVTFVLKSIRLPESTIYLALNYLHKSVNKLKKQQQSSTESKSSIFADASENVIYQYLVIALVLANKFNDDKTFTNKSWSEATGMDLQTINKMERELLNLFNWNLNDVIFETKLYAEYAKSFEIYSNAMSCKREASNHFNVPSAAPSQPSHHYTQQQQQHTIPSYDYVESSPLLNYNYGANTSVQAPQYATHGQNDLCPSAATPGSSNGLETPITLPSMLNNSSNNYFFSSPTGPESQSFVAQPHQYQQPARTYNDYSSPSNYYNNQYPHPSANMGMSSNYYAHPQNYMSGPMPVDMQLQNQMQMQPHPQMQISKNMAFLITH